MACRSFNDSQKDLEAGSPLSSCSTATGSMRDVSIGSSVSSSASGAPDQPNWPRQWRAYSCWAGCFFLMFNSWGLVNAYGTFASYYVGQSLRDSDQLQLNLIGSMQSFLVLIFSLPVGRLLDAGYFRQIIGLGAFLTPFGMFMLSIAHPSDPSAKANYGAILSTQGVVTGLGMACYFVSSSQVAATWFPNRKGLAVGGVACGASVAGVVYPTMTRYLIDILGFVNACRCVAGLVALTSIFSFIFAVPSPSVHLRKPKSWLSVNAWLDPAAFRNPAFCWFTASISALFFGFYPVFFNLEEWAAVSGYGTRESSPSQTNAVVPNSDALQTFWLLTIMNGASTIGRITMASFSDKTGPLNMHIVTQIVSSLLVLILWTLTGSTSAAISFCVFFGMFSGAVIGLPPASMANILKCTYNTEETHHLSHSKLGQWTGMMYSIAGIPSLAGPIIAGYLVTKYNTYITVQMWSGTCLMISAVCMLVTRWYLPCEDGQHVRAHIAHFFKRSSEATDDNNEKSSACDARDPAALEAQIRNSISHEPAFRCNSEDTTRVNTRLPTRANSRLNSGEKVNTLGQSKV
ncbi:major facilitator superfamily domain-containing protein [Dendryphion nanum]|uniref:Major facilitator superfamily domain-containing protein n=1 Tax=Dendryphion nanum TaxID=256645 RepID=A0A9P9IY57_9PLEO|nr:major facilitator superfamily domain-containing protein [Dendryphion nanum]